MGHILYLLFGYIVVIGLCYFVYIVIKGLIKLVVFLIVVLPLEIFINLALLFRLIKRNPLKESEWYKKWFPEYELPEVDYTVIDRDWGYQEMEKNDKDIYANYLHGELRKQLLYEK